MKLPVLYRTAEFGGLWMKLYYFYVIWNEFMDQKKERERRVTEVALLFSLSRIYDKRDRGGIDALLGSLFLHWRRVRANFTVQNITV